MHTFCCYVNDKQLMKNSVLAADLVPPHKKFMKSRNHSMGIRKHAMLVIPIDVKRTQWSLSPECQAYETAHVVFQIVRKFLAQNFAAIF